MLRDLKVTSPNAVSRSQAYIRANVQVDGASNFVVERLTIVEAEQNGIIIHNESDGGIVRDNNVSQTLADAIHITDATEDILVTNNTVRDAGDDLIAVVSYLAVDPRRCKNITIVGNDVARQTNGRGISNVGGESVTIKNNTIAETNGAGVWSPRTGITARSARSTRRCSTTSSTRPTSATSTAGIQIYGQPGNMAQNTLVRGNIVRNTMYRGIYIGPNSQGTLVDDNELREDRRARHLGERSARPDGDRQHAHGDRRSASHAPSQPAVVQGERSRGSTLRARVASTSSTSSRTQG